MATIDISKSHTLGKETAKTRASALLDKLAESYGIKGTWNGDNFKIEKPVTGNCAVTDTVVRIEIDLPLMMRPMKGKIETRVNDELAKALV